MYRLKQPFKKLPVGCIAGIVATSTAKTEDTTTMVVVDPEKYRGKVFQVNPDQMEDVMEEQTDHVYDHIFLRKDHRKKGKKIYGEDNVEAATKRRPVRTPYPVGTWYYSKDPILPVFFLIRFDHSNFEVRRPYAEAGDTVRVDYPRMRRADPKPLTLEIAQALGFDIDPEEFTEGDNSSYRGVS